jgi:hypothetical protein
VVVRRSAHEWRLPPNITDLAVPRISAMMLEENGPGTYDFPELSGANQLPDRLRVRR